MLQFTQPNWQVEVQTPPEQSAPSTWLGEHARSQAPQFRTLVARLASHPVAACASQFSQPTLQTKPQLPLTQVLVAFARFGQTTPQPPQLFTSFCVLTQRLPHSTVPPGQFSVQFPETQTLPPVHACPQPPQLFASFWVSTQALPHLVSPPLQVNVHCWPWQTGVPPEGAPQPTPHPPQFCVVFGSTQALPHLINPPVQVKPQVPLLQLGTPPVGAEQTIPQPPQLLVSDAVATH